MHIRVVESDAAPANIKAEKILNAASNSSEEQPVALLHSLCCAHRLHTSAQRCWAMEQDIITGLTRLCLVLSGAGAMGKIYGAIDVLVEQRFVHVQNVSLPAAAKEYRARLTELALVPKSQPKRRADMDIIMTNIINGDLRKADVIEHHCPPGCCQDVHEAKHKMKKGLRKIFRNAPTRLICQKRLEIMARKLAHCDLWLRGALSATICIHASLWRQ